MKFEKYYISNSFGKSNCVIRSFCKIFNLNYDEVYNELCSIQNELKAEAYNDIVVFETFLNKHGIESIDYGKDIMLKDLKLDNGSYVVFCSNKEDYYHMVTVIDNTLYDKDDSSLDLYTIKLYKKK